MTAGALLGSSFHSAQSFSSFGLFLDRCLGGLETADTASNLMRANDGCRATVVFVGVTSSLLRITENA